MAVRISSVETEELIAAVDQEEVIPKKKMEVLEAFMSRYNSGLSQDGKRPAFRGDFEVVATVRRRSCSI